MSETSGKTGNKKVFIVALLFLTWFVGNLDRFGINYAVIAITKEFHLSASSTGLVLSMFFAGYAIMQFPGGLLADKFGSKRILTIIIVIWSFFTIMTGFATGLTSLLVIRLLFGFSEGGFSPTAMKLVSETYEKKEQGKVMSIFLASGPISAMILPLLATSLMIAFGWRSIFYIIGACGFIVALIYIFFFKHDSKAIAAEAQVTEEPAIKFTELLKQPMIWLLFIANYAVYTVTWGMSSWVPTYLASARHLSLTTLGWVSMLPGITGIFSMLGSGAFLDAMKKGRKDKIFGAIAMVCVAILLLIMYSTPSLAAYVVFSMLLQLCTSAATILLPKIMMKNVPSKQVGKTMGFVNTGAQLAGFTTPLVIGFIVQGSGGFFGAFMFMAIFAVVCAISIIAMRDKADA